MDGRVCALCKSGKGMILVDMKNWWAGIKPAFDHAEKEVGEDQAG